MVEGREVNEHVSPDFYWLDLLARKHIKPRRYRQLMKHPVVRAPTLRSLRGTGVQRGKRGGFGGVWAAGRAGRAAQPHSSP